MVGRDSATFAIRRGRPEDVDAILDLLTEYDLPRTHFAPAYLRDPDYRPEHSWLVEVEGRLAAHLRVFDRSVRVGGAALRIAGVGNVITASEHRSRGYAGSLLQAMLRGVEQAGFAYSLLWTHLPDWYGRYGWVPIDETVVRARLPAPDRALAIAPFCEDDLPAIMCLYERTNAQRTGTAIRAAAYWRGQLDWLREDRAGFLVARSTAGAVAGYVRSRADAGAAEILDLGVDVSATDVGRALLAAAARDREIFGVLPPSLCTLFRPGEHEVRSRPGLMGRVVNLPALVRTLEPVWQQRAQATSVGDGAVTLATSAGRAQLRVSAARVQVGAATARSPAPALDERALAHLLFHGFDGTASAHLGPRADETLLRALFPPQDFVIWQADAF